MKSSNIFVSQKPKARIGMSQANSLLGGHAQFDSSNLSSSTWVVLSVEKSCE